MATFANLPMSSQWVSRGIQDETALAVAVGQNFFLEKALTALFATEKLDRCGSKFLGILLEGNEIFNDAEKAQIIAQAKADAASLILRSLPQTIDSASYGKFIRQIQTLITGYITRRTNRSWLTFKRGKTGDGYYKAIMALNVAVTILAGQAASKQLIEKLHKLHARLNKVIAENVFPDTEDNQGMHRTMAHICEALKPAHNNADGVISSLEESVNKNAFIECINNLKNDNALEEALIAILYPICANDSWQYAACQINNAAFANDAESATAAGNAIREISTIAASKPDAIENYLMILANSLGNRETKFTLISLIANSSDLVIRQHAQTCLREYRLPVLISVGAQFYIYGCSAAGKFHLNKFKVNDFNDVSGQFPLGLFPNVNDKRAVVGILSASELSLTVISEINQFQYHVKLADFDIAKIKVNLLAALHNAKLENWITDGEQTDKENFLVKTAEITVLYIQLKARKQLLLQLHGILEQRGLAVFDENQAFAKITPVILDNYAQLLTKIAQVGRELLKHRDNLWNTYCNIQGDKNKGTHKSTSNCAAAGIRIGGLIAENNRAISALNTLKSKLPKANEIWTEVDFKKHVFQLIMDSKKRGIPIPRELEQIAICEISAVERPLLPKAQQPRKASEKSLAAIAPVKIKPQQEVQLAVLLKRRRLWLILLITLAAITILPGIIWSVTALFSKSLRLWFQQQWSGDVALLMEQNYSLPRSAQTALLFQSDFETTLTNSLKEKFIQCLAMQQDEIEARYAVIKNIFKRFGLQRNELNNIQHLEGKRLVVRGVLCVAYSYMQALNMENKKNPALLHKALFSRHTKKARLDAIEILLVEARFDPQQLDIISEGTLGQYIRSGLAHYQLNCNSFTGINFRDFVLEHGVNENYLLAKVRQFVKNPISFFALRGATPANKMYMALHVLMRANELMDIDNVQRFIEQCAKFENATGAFSNNYELTVPVLFMVLGVQHSQIARAALYHFMQSIIGQHNLSEVLRTFIEQRFPRFDFNAHYRFCITEILVGEILLYEKWLQQKDCIGRTFRHTV